MISLVLFAQILGIIGWLLLVYSYYKDDIDKLLYIQIISSIFYCLSYLFLGAYSGLIVCFIELLKGIGYYKTDKDELIFFVTLPVYILTAIFTYDGIISLLPVIGSIIDGFSLTKNKNIATAGSIISNFLWLIYDIVILAFASALTDGVLVVSNCFLLLFGYSRLLKSNKLRIAQTRTFSKNVYNVISVLDKNTYGDEYTWTYEYEKNINTKNNDSVLTIKYRDQIVGYISYFVLNELEYNKIINSDIVLKEYDLNNVVKYRKNKKNYLIIDSINVKHEFQNHITINLIVKKLKSIIVKRYKQDYKIESIISISVDKFEKEVLEKAGFSEYKKYLNDKTLYMIDNQKIEEIYLKNIIKKSDYKIIYGDKIKDEMIKEIGLLDKKFFKEEHLWENEYQLQLFNKNKNSIIMLKYNNRLIGYLNYLVITKEKYEQMINSNVIVDEFTLDEVTKFYKSKKNYITINSIVIDKKHQDGYAVRLLTQKLKRILKKMNFNGYKIGGINSFAVSADGRKFLENLGFEKCKELEDNYYLYTLENNKLKDYLK